MGHCQGSPKGSSFTESKINYYSSKDIFKEKLMERQMPLAGFQERKQDFAGSIVTTLLGRYVPSPPRYTDLWTPPLGASAMYHPKTQSRCLCQSPENQGKVLLDVIDVVPLGLKLCPLQHTDFRTPLRVHLLHTIIVIKAKGPSVTRRAKEWIFCWHRYCLARVYLPSLLLPMLAETGGLLNETRSH